MRKSFFCFLAAYWTKQKPGDERPIPDHLTRENYLRKIINLPEQLNKKVWCLIPNRIELTDMDDEKDILYEHEPLPSYDGILDSEYYFDKWTETSHNPTRTFYISQNLIDLISGLVVNKAGEWIQKPNKPEPIISVKFFDISDSDDDDSIKPDRDESKPIIGLSSSHFGNKTKILETLKYVIEHSSFQDHYYRGEGFTAAFPEPIFNKGDGKIMSIFVSDNFIINEISFAGYEKSFVLMDKSESEKVDISIEQHLDIFQRQLMNFRPKLQNEVVYSNMHSSNLIASTCICKQE